MPQAIPKPPGYSSSQLPDTYISATLELYNQYIPYNTYTSKPTQRLGKTIINGCFDTLKAERHDAAASRFLAAFDIGTKQRNNNQTSFFHNASLCALPELAWFLACRISNPHLKKADLRTFSMLPQIADSIDHILNDSSKCTHNTPRNNWLALGQLTLAGLLDRQKNGHVMPSLPQFNNPRKQPGNSGYSALFIERQDGKLTHTPVQIIPDCVGICYESNDKMTNPDTLAALKGYDGPVRHASLCCDLQMPHKNATLLPQLVLKEAQGNVSDIEREVLDLTGNVVLQAIQTNRFAQPMQA